MRSIASCAAILLLALCPATAGAEPADDERERVLAAGEQWIQHYEAADLEALMTLYADDVFVALHGQPALRGKQAVRDFFAARLGRSRTSFELETERVDISGDTAWVVSKYWLHATNQETGRVYKDAGRSLLIYRKRGGRWKIAADLDQSTPDVGWPSPAGRD